MQQVKELTQLSPSKLTAFMTCPIKFYARYILGIKSPPTLPMILGQAVHKALELLGRRRQFDLAVTLDEVVSEYHEAWRDEITTAEIDPPDAAKELAAGVLMLKAYWQKYEHEKPVASELRLEEPLINPATGEAFTAPDGTLALVGVVDSLVAEDDGLVIVDYKTTARTSSPASINLTHRLQLLAYAYLLRNATDQPVKALEVRQIVNKKEPDVAVVRVPLPPQVSYDPLFLVVENLFHSLKTNRWMARYNFLCSSACEGFGQCSPM